MHKNLLLASAASLALATALLAAQLGQPQIWKACVPAGTCGSITNNIRCTDPNLLTCTRCSASTMIYKCEGPVVENPCEPETIASGCGFYEVGTCSAQGCADFVLSTGSCDQPWCAH